MEGNTSERLLKKAEGADDGADREEKLEDKVWSEMRKIWVVAGPATFTKFSTFGIYIVSQAFVGHIGATELAAYALVSTVILSLNINGWEMMIALGFLAAASVRVSNELGRGSSKAAKFSIVMTVVTSLAIGFVLFTFFLFFRGRLAYIFTKSEEVATAVADLSPLLATSILLNSVQPVLSGVAVGAGRQGIIAYVNIGCYYLIGIPIGVVLGYVIKMQVKGVWLGMLLGTLAQTLVLIQITYSTDWEKQVSIAQQRIRKWQIEPEETNSNSRL